MEQRLKVAHFYQPLNFTCAIEIDNLEKAYFVQQRLFVTTKDAPIILQQFSLKSKSKEREILLPYEGLAGVEMLGSLVCLFFSGNEDLFIYSNQKILSLKSHFMPITTLISHRGNIYTGSVDMTIRIWNAKKQTLVQDPKLHALSAHTGAINFFLSVEEYLMSASADKSVIVWKGTKIHAKKNFTSQIIMMIQCPQSRQLVFCEQDGSIRIIDSRILAKEKRIQIIRTIDETITHPLVGMHEMDDSFLELILPSRVSIAQINLGAVMAQLDLGEKIEVIRSKCLRRMTLLAVSMRGLFTVTF